MNIKIKEIIKNNTIKELKKNHTDIFDTLVKNNNFELYYKEKYITHTINSIYKEALLYNNRNDFKLKSSGKHSYARFYGILDKVCLHMKPIREKWNKNKVLEIGKNVKNLSQFKKEYRGAYKYATNNNFLKDMIKKCNWEEPPMENNIIYIWELKDVIYQNKKVYKIGVTSKKSKFNRINTVANKIKKTPIIIKYKLVKDALKIETYLLSLYPSIDLYNKSIDGNSEFRALNLEELNNILSKINLF